MTRTATRRTKRNDAGVYSRCCWIVVVFVVVGLASPALALSLRSHKPKNGLANNGVHHSVEPQPQNTRWVQEDGNATVDTKMEEAADSADSAVNATDTTTENNNVRAGFTIIAVGPYGGIDQAHVTSFLLQGVSWTTNDMMMKNKNKNMAVQRGHFVSLDGGTTVSGIQAAVDANNMDDILNNDAEYTTNYSLNLTQVGYVFLHGVQAYLLTHPHQDHNVGLTISATDDVAGSKKPVYGIEFTTSTIQNDTWNWKSWPNFGSQGISPLNTYDLITVQADASTSYDCPPTTQLSFRAFPLLHGSYPTDTGAWLPYPSTAYLLEYNTSSSGSNNPKVLFLGDSGADSISNTTHLQHIWKAVAPYVADGTLHVILLECSYTDAQPDKSLFGHLKPKLFVQEMVVLRDLVMADQQLDKDVANAAMSKVKIIVQHIKPSTILFKASDKQTTGDIIVNELKQWSATEGLTLDLVQPLPGGRYDTY